MIKLRVLDLFSGIGGFSLGLERTGGFETVAFCEIEDYPRRVLAKHWPKVPCYNDVRELTADTLRRDGIAVDVICGGFPCQDISFAGKGAGLAGERSGLWREYARLIRELRPRFVIVENVSALLNRGLGDVLGHMAALGYDAEWHCIPASAVGAPHRRDRLWIVAYPGGEQHEGRGLAIRRSLAAQLHAANAESGRSRCDGEGREQELACGFEDLADTERSRLERLDGRQQSGGRRQRASDNARSSGSSMANANQPSASAKRQQRSWEQLRTSGDTKENFRRRPACQWIVEPDVGRVVDGVPRRVDRLRGLGNAVVPQIPQLIGQAILQAEGMTA